MLSKLSIVSFVIPATDNHVGDAIYSILGQAESPYKLEIIIVLNNCSENILLELTGYFAAQIKNGLVRILFQQKATIGSARNFGIKNAAGKYIVHMDSDCRLGPGYLKALLQRIQEKPFMIARGSLSFVSKNNFLSRASCTLKNLVYKSRKNVCYTPNLIVNIDVYKKMNLWFDTSFLYGEDTEFSIRIAHMQMTPLQISILRMIHYDYDRGFHIFKRYFSYGIARAYRFHKWKIRNGKVYFYRHIFNEIPSLGKIYPQYLRFGILLLYLIRDLGVFYGLLTILIK